MRALLRALTPPLLAGAACSPVELEIAPLAFEVREISGPVIPEFGGPYVRIVDGQVEATGGTFGTLCRVGFEGTLWRGPNDLRLRISILYHRNAVCPAGGNVVEYRALTRDLTPGSYRLRIEGYDPERAKVTGTIDTTVIVPDRGA